ncbi:OmpA family protein [Panacibacter ginsenosidivorans]|uniref:OmpA family protein n=1 Tax=Panacibacter ginsenosidivorans TaxID=1813871 RepID=A0A5B8V9A1_9BACT|nr:OmpA family protein [Panacibacter ginsenosidivorans]QEC67819.1 OmpA family protein [Panacibacter ginsenosidivorans]
MNKEHFDEHSIRKYTLTIFLAFAAVFCFVILMMQWKGDFIPGSEHASVTVTEGVKEEVATVEKVTPNPASIKVTLPAGIEIEALKGGIEDKLTAFLNDPDSKPGKDVWFDFDNLNFKTNSAEITEESNVQVQNIAAILKAYPKLKIKIGGYTDKTGDSVANVQLSQKRADAVLEALKKTNANPEQLLGAEGYGSQYAKTAADAPDEERKRDRRISLSVREK